MMHNGRIALTKQGVMQGQEVYVICSVKGAFVDIEDLGCHQLINEESGFSATGKLSCKKLHRSYYTNIFVTKLGETGVRT